MQKNQFRSRQFRGAVIFAEVIYTAALLGWVVSVTVDYRQASESLRSRQAKLSSLERELANLKKGTHDFKREREKLEALLFKQRDVPTFLDEVSGFAKDAKVDIRDLTTRTLTKVVISEKPGENAADIRGAQSTGNAKDDDLAIMLLPIQMTIKGDFENIVDFLNRLESYRLLTTLTDVAITARDYPVLECALIVNIYSLNAAGKK